MAKEEEMTDAENGDKPLSNGVVDVKDGGEVKEEGPSLHEQLKSNVALLEKAVRSKDLRLIQGRLHRQTAVVRRQLNPEALSAFVWEVLPQGHHARTTVLRTLYKVGQVPLVAEGLKAFRWLDTVCGAVIIENAALEKSKQITWCRHVNLLRRANFTISERFMKVYCKRNIRFILGLCFAGR